MRLSFNQATAKYWPLDQAVKGCLDQGVGGIGLWRDQVADFGFDAAVRLIKDSGLPVTSLCRGGFFCDQDWYDDNRRAIDEAAALGTGVLVLVCGGLGSRSLDDARSHVGEAIGTLVPHALAAGVRLAVEPLHPMFCSDRSVVATLSQALDLAAPYPSEAVGITVDTYHIWWDDQVWAQLARAGDRIACFQLADWITPLPADALLGRGLPGTGCIPMARFIEAVDATGYDGPIEVEVFHADLWARPGEEILADTVAAYRAASTPS